MRWLTNIHNPELPDAKAEHVYVTDDHGLEWAYHLKWLSDKHIGLPKASDTMTVSQLQEQNYVGVYKI